MKKIKKIFKWNIKDFSLVIFGSFLFCFAINNFIVPNNLYNGGVLGLSQLIRSFAIDTLKLNINFDFSGILYYFINIPLFVLAYKSINKVFFARTIFAVSIQTLMLSFIPSPNVPVLDDMFTSVVIGGILCGAGTGIVLSCGSSTGGTDIIGIILTLKNNNFSVGKFGLIVNIIIYGLSGILYGIPTMIYSIIYCAIDSMTMDKLHTQNIISTAFIFCKKNPKKINNFIKNELGRDFTYWHAYGGYDDSRTYIIYTTISKYELGRLERFTKKIDDNIFIVKSEGITINGNFKKSF